uniref:Glucosamine/galactosamine-6-phosphate isomerase domain-containing protein n=1 Tax=Populus trichocarpa TaxID=3694 RepID=A0A2K1XG47_POPTR
MGELENYLVPILPGDAYAINNALSAEGAADDYETCLKLLVHTGVVDKSSLSGLPKFDRMLIGTENQEWVTSVSPKPPPERITFTFPVINSSEHIALVCGAGKAGVVESAVGNNQNSDANDSKLQDCMS